MSAAWARKIILFTLAIVLVVTGFVAGTAVVLTNARPIAQSTVAALKSQATVNAPMTEVEQIYANVYNQVSPSVVSINVVARIDNNFSQGFFAEGTGTGFVIDNNGHIVTNYHVVEGASRIEVNFFDGTITRAEIVGVDPDSDLAVIRVDLPAEQLHPVTFGDSDQLFVGQSVIALGSPFGQRWTMTTGIVSAINRTIQGLGQYQIGAVIQTDAAINPGNSGGPLLDLQGRVIGVNAQIMSRNRSSSGVGFSIPSNLVQRVASDLINQGFVNYSYLGISSRPNDVDLAVIEAMGLPNNTRGVVIESVDQTGPAGRAGLRNASNHIRVDGMVVPTRADIITAIDGQEVTGFDTLIAYLASSTVPGQTVNLTVLRDGQYITVPVTLGERPRTR